jgi:cyanophycin synthetase
VPQLLREALLANGVPADQIRVIPSEEAAVDGALREAEAGDLVLVFGDAITRSWKQIIQFHPEAAPPPAEPRRASPPEPALAAVAPILEDQRREFVRDSRGVRIAREEMAD